MPHTPVTDQDKKKIWDAYRTRKPVRVPMILWTNARVVHALPEWNVWGYSFEDAYHDPLAHVRMQLQHQLFVRRVLNRYTDGPTELPAKWVIGQDVYNVFEAASLGATVNFPDGQVPCTSPMFGDDATKHDVFKIDIEHPLESAWVKQRLAFWHEMDRVCKGMTFEGKPVELSPWALMGSDGPVTGACNVRGGSFMLDLLEDPEYADRLLTFLTDAVIHRRNAFKQYWGDRVDRAVRWMADDSCAMLSVPMYEERVAPHHKRLYDDGTTRPGEDRFMHLCGNATHLFPSIQRLLHVTIFDTGFPVDHGKIRQELGPDVEIQGGPEVKVIMEGTPNDIYERARSILTSGVKAGGRFLLREGNNLPPLAPLDNLEAMYRACLDHGGYHNM